MYYDANYPDILLSDLERNPKLSNWDRSESITMMMCRENRYDYEEYEKFLKAAVNNFRSTLTYKHYKGYLYSIGLDCCQFHPYIQNSEEYKMADLEMHHCMINIFDIAIMISEHYLNTVGGISEFMLAKILKAEHAANRLPLVMLCKSCHQKYHHKGLYVHPEQVFGRWWELIEVYNQGWTREIIEKLIRYLNRGLGEKFQYRQEDAKKLLALRDRIASYAGNGGVLLDGCPNPYGCEGFANDEDWRSYS